MACKSIRYVVGRLENCRIMINRIEIFNKYNGHCAYCGKEIEIKDMQVDHIISKHNGGTDDVENLNPSCRRCNHYKRTSGIETFRRMVSEIPKKLDRDSYIYKVGEDYGFYKPHIIPIKFYFEKTTRG